MACNEFCGLESRAEGRESYFTQSLESGNRMDYSLKQRSSQAIFTTVRDLQVRALEVRLARSEVDKLRLQAENEELKAQLQKALPTQ
jgi:hypothetical protein